ncbi:MAG: anaerobic ribonucleoside-triphosphate reductase activating protein [Oscillospiraceae bacterium]|nr:anaerobic ribonucleoside-triphosphate reductase activating protein [Oscillospiraceae bacterium]
MRIAGLIQDSIVDGPGFRFVVFVQGCRMHCEGCHNPDTWDIEGGTAMLVEDVVAEMLSNPLTDGLTLSGGEPFLQAAECALLAAAAHENGLNVWAYSGHTFEELMDIALSDSDVGELLQLVDVLIDGAFVLQERTLSLRWRGSRNQRVVDVKRSLAAGGAVEFESGA